MLHPINPSLNKLIFLLKFCRFYNILAKIFNDLPFPCQDLQRSSISLPRSSRILTGKCKILAKKWKIPEDLGKKMKDPWKSWQENERSSKILARKWKIPEDLRKNFEDLQRFSKGHHEDSQEDPQRSSWRCCRHVTSCFVLFCVTEKFISPCWKSSVSSKFTAYFVKQLTK